MGQWLSCILVNDVGFDKEAECIEFKRGYLWFCCIDLDPLLFKLKECNFSQLSSLTHKLQLYSNLQLKKDKLKG